MCYNSFIIKKNFFNEFPQKTIMVDCKTGPSSLPTWHQMPFLVTFLLSHTWLWTWSGNLLWSVYIFRKNMTELFISAQHTVGHHSSTGLVLWSDFILNRTDADSLEKNNTWGEFSSAVHFSPYFFIFLPDLEMHLFETFFLLLQIPKE